jgi:hypothetical protein
MYLVLHSLETKVSGRISSLCVQQLEWIPKLAQSRRSPPLILPSLSFPNYSEKKALDLEVEALDSQDIDDNISGTKLYVPDDNDEFIDPRLKDYPILLVA